jgi:hypothetical protein
LHNILLWQVLAAAASGRPSRRIGARAKIPPRAFHRPLPSLPSRLCGGTESRKPGAVSGLSLLARRESRGAPLFLKHRSITATSGRETFNAGEAA